MLKVLFCFLTFFCSICLASQVAAPEDAKQIISSIKDIEIKEMMKKTSEFNSCREKHAFDDSNKSLTEAEKCFKQILEKKSPEELEKLSNTLNLQTYGLVKSNNSKEIQKYLTNKMIHSLTGIDPEEKDRQKKVENLKFGRKKIVDQSVFIKLYKTQLGKNALFEISRFCFEDLRADPTPESTISFLDYWKTRSGALDSENQVHDLGQPKFGTQKFSDPKNKEKLYEEIFNNIGQADPSATAFLQDFFIRCGKLITPLCKRFKDKGGKIGSAACLTQDRIRAYRTALSKAEKLMEYFDREMSTDPNNLALALENLTQNDPLKIYGDGSDNELTIDELTNNSSTTFLEGEHDQVAQDKAQQCQESPELATCEDFFITNDSLDRVKHKIEQEMSLKREIEMERVRKLVQKDKQSLKEYLEKNGYLELLKDDAYKNMGEADLADFIAKEINAKKDATLTKIQEKMGKRQIRNDSDLKNVNVEEVVANSTEERARMAQVVLFNNIITSHLSLQKDDGSGNLVDIGRNTGVWSSESSALEKLGVNEKYFKNFNSLDGGNKPKRGEEISDFSLLDSLLE